MMNASATTHKLVTVLNKKLEIGVVLNSAAHTALGLAARAAKQRPELLEAMQFVNYADADGNEHAFISALPLIVLRAKSGEIRKLRARLLEKGILFTDFTNQMTGGTYLDQLERSRNTPEAALEYHGLCAIGLREELDPLTKRLSLWQ